MRQYLNILDSILKYNQTFTKLSVYELLSVCALPRTEVRAVVLFVISQLGVAGYSRIPPPPELLLLELLRFLRLALVFYFEGVISSIYIKLAVDIDLAPQHRGPVSLSEAPPIIFNLLSKRSFLFVLMNSHNIAIQKA
mgnify:CR=1 FL=1